MGSTFGVKIKDFGLGPVESMISLGHSTGNVIYAVGYRSLH